jgi:hypothetical protein
MNCRDFVFALGGGGALAASRSIQGIIIIIKRVEVAGNEAFWYWKTRVSKDGDWNSGCFRSWIHGGVEGR